MNVFFGLLGSARVKAWHKMLMKLTTGCILLIQLLMPFSGIYCLLFPLSIALLRYCLVVHGNWTKSIGINRFVTIIIFLSVVVPCYMTISLQFPVGNHIHGPYNNCVGRFEIFFNPTHPDPFTSGANFINVFRENFLHERSFSSFPLVTCT